MIHGTPMYNKICGYLVQMLGITTREAREAIPQRVTEWRQLKISQVGDTITAKGCQKICSDARNSSFVRVSNYFVYIALKLTIQEWMLFSTNFWLAGFDRGASWSASLMLLSGGSTIIFLATFDSRAPARAA
jgi:hypothetical protein